MEPVWDCGFPHWNANWWNQWSSWSAGGNDMMIGGRRGHNGTVNQRSISTKVRLQNGTVIILRKPGATILAH